MGLDQDDAWGRTIDALNAEKDRNGTKLHFRVESGGKVTADAHDLKNYAQQFGQDGVDALLNGGQQGPLHFNRDTNKVELLSAMSDDQVAAFRQSARAIGEAVRGNVVGAQVEFETMQLQGNMRGLADAINDKNLQGKTHLKFSEGADRVWSASTVDEEGRDRFGELWQREQARIRAANAQGGAGGQNFADELLGGGMHYDPAGHRIVVDQNAAAYLPNFTDNARAVGKAIDGDENGARNEYHKLRVLSASQPAIEGQGDDWGRTIDSLNADKDRHGAKLHFRRDDDGKVTAGAHDLGVYADKYGTDEVNKLLNDGDAKGPLRFYRDSHNKARVQLIAPMTDDQLNAFHQNAAAIGQAVRGNLTATTNELDTMYPNDGMRGLADTINDKNLQGKTHLKFAEDVNGVWSADAGRMGEIWQREQARINAAGAQGGQNFVDELLGGGMHYDAASNRVVVNPNASPEDIRNFAGNARAIGKAFNGDEKGAHNLDQKLHIPSVPQREEEVAALPLPTEEKRTEEKKIVTQPQASTWHVVDITPLQQQEVCPPEHPQLSERDTWAAAQIMMEKLRRDGAVVDAVDGTMHPMRSQLIPKNLSADKHHFGIDGNPGETHNPVAYGDTARELAAFKHNIGNAEDAQLDPDTFKKLVLDYQRKENLTTQNGELTKETRDRILVEEHDYRDKFAQGQAGGMKVSDKVTLDQSLSGDKDPLPSGSLEGQNAAGATQGFTYARRQDAPDADNTRSPIVKPKRENGNGRTGEDGDGPIDGYIKNMRKIFGGTAQKTSYVPQNLPEGELVTPAVVRTGEAIIKPKDQGDLTIV